MDTYDERVGHYVLCDSGAELRGLSAVDSCRTSEQGYPEAIGHDWRIDAIERGGHRWIGVGEGCALGFLDLARCAAGAISVCEEVQDASAAREQQYRPGRRGAGDGGCRARLRCDRGSVEDRKS